MLIKDDKRIPVDPLANWERLVIRENNVNQPVRCHDCHQVVPLNKKTIEDHIRVIHKPERPFQCGFCEYANPDEVQYPPAPRNETFQWKVRMHMSLKHPDKPLVPIKSCSSWNRPHLYLRKYFPELAG